MTTQSSHTETKAEFSKMEEFDEFKLRFWYEGERYGFRVSLDDLETLKHSAGEEIKVVRPEKAGLTKEQALAFVSNYEEAPPIERKRARET